VLRAAGASVETLAGCCGLAGNFSIERALRGLGRRPRAGAAPRRCAPALEGTVLFADGFSCRTQAAQLAGWPALPLAELLGLRRGNR
jgi:hypothetical protein